MQTAKAKIPVRPKDDSTMLLALSKSSVSDIRTIILDKNYGFAEGYNRALQQVESEYYVLLNSDVDVPEGWLTPLLSFMN